MSGHSKWANIKRQKGVADARRGQVFTKLTREIIVAVKQGGTSLESNFRLRLAVDKAKAQNMPTDNIQRAIQRASGGGEGMALAEVHYEGYGPGGSAILVQVLTDNRNRVLQEIRNVFSRSGGSLAEAGSVAWMFESRGVVTVDAGSADGEELALQALDAGADDVKVEQSFIEVYTKPEDLEKLRPELEKKPMKITSSEVTMVAKTMLQLDEKNTLSLLIVLDKLEELEDVQEVYTNVDFSAEIVEKLRAQV